MKKFGDKFVLFLENYGVKDKIYLCSRHLLHKQIYAKSGETETRSVEVRGDLIISITVYPSTMAR
jgi:hypothetical protein